MKSFVSWSSLCWNRHTGKLPIHGEAGDKAALYRDRFQLLLQRLSRDKYFSRPAFDTIMSDSDSYEVCFFKCFSPKLAIFLFQ